MDPQVASSIRSFLVSLGTIFAGTGVAQYFTDAYINIAVAVIGTLIALGTTWWGVQSNKPAALVQKLMDNTQVENKDIIKAVETNNPQLLTK